MTMGVFALALVGVFYPYNRGALLSALIIIYALTSGIAGYVAANNYRQMGGENWVRNVLLTGFLFCGPMFVTFSFLNTVAIAYRSTAALPFGTICIILIIWALVTFPLTVLGGVAGKNAKGFDVFVSIENGIVAKTRGSKQFLDVAWVVAEVAKTGNVVEVCSAGIPVPSSAVAAAREQGFASHTAGAVIADMFKGESDDPHAAITAGSCCRGEILATAVKAAAGCAFANAARGLKSKRE